MQAALNIPSVTSCENKALLLPLLFDPGERWEYGIGIDWPGKMVETVSGQKLGAYLKDSPRLKLVVQRSSNTEQ